MMNPMVIGINNRHHHRGLNFP